MAVINLADKYSKKVAERFALSSITDAYAGKDYDFTGVKSIKIYSINTVGMNNYNRSGTDRFGQLEELGDTIQEMVMSRDRSFTYSIDKGNNAQQFNVKAATHSLKRQIDEVVTPELDQYRLKVWCGGAGLLATGAAPSKSDVMTRIMTGGMAMSNALVPKTKRTLFIKESVYLNCKLSTEVIGLEKLGEKAVKDGSVGTLDGMKVVPVPDSYFPAGVNFFIKYKGATVDPVQLKTYRVLTEQRGIDGDVVEGRIIYDSFVLGTRANGLYVDALTAAAQANPTITAGTNNWTITSSGATGIVYTTDGSDPKTSETAQPYAEALTGLTAGTVIKAYAYKTGLLNSGVTTFKV